MPAAMRASTPLATLCAVAALAGAPRLALAEGECAAAAEAYGLVSSRCLAELLTTRGGVKKSACDTDCYTDFVAAADALSAAVAVDQSCQVRRWPRPQGHRAFWHTKRSGSPNCAVCTSSPTNLRHRTRSWRAP